MVVSYQSRDVSMPAPDHGVVRAWAVRKTRNGPRQFTSKRLSRLPTHGPLKQSLLRRTRPHNRHTQSPKEKENGTSLCVVPVLAAGLAESRQDGCAPWRPHTLDHCRGSFLANLKDPNQSLLTQSSHLNRGQSLFLVPCVIKLSALFSILSSPISTT